MKALILSALIVLSALALPVEAEARGFRGGFRARGPVVVRRQVFVQAQPVIVRQRRVGPVRRIVGAVRGSIRGAVAGFRGF